jgi:chemotaxis protein methyltransferase CheR
MVEITEKEFRQLSQYIQKNYGIHLKEEKKALLTGRLQNILLENECSTYSEYIDLIQTDKTGKLITDFVNRITTNHTYFMREVEHFEYFKNSILPYLKNNVKDKDLRIWSAGCSSGEEPVTLAMLLNDYFGNEKMFWDTKILATDISDEVLNKAQKGQYANEQLTYLPAAWRMNYFNAIDSESSVLKDKIKEDIIFRRFNLMDEIFPFKKKFHVIFCRNVMIYFDNKTKTELVRKFYEATETGGYLLIGHAETLNRETTKYKYILPAVYRKE